MNDPSYPILEFDPTREAMIEPSDVFQPRDVPEHCVICFFREAIEKVVSEKQAKIVATHQWEDGPHHLYEINHQNKRLGFIHPGVGAPMAAGILEDMVAHGCHKFIVCGGCGVLEKGIAVGHLIVVSSAIRDEGTSYH
jgi:uridine phosphorylase